MDTVEQRLRPVAALVLDALRWEGVSLALYVVSVPLFARLAPSSALAATALLAFGVGLVARGVSLRASGRLLAIAQAPAPRWLAWAAPLYVVAGVVIASYGAWLLTGLLHQAP